VRPDSTASTGSCPACGSFFLAITVEFWRPRRADLGFSKRPPAGRG
jgi:hypothetical protein